MFDEERRNKCRRKPCTKNVEELRQAGVTDPTAIFGMFFEPPITRDPIGGWQKRIVSIKSEMNGIKAVKKYHSLRLEMNDLYDDVMRSASALENYLDYLRGK